MLSFSGKPGLSALAAAALLLCLAPRQVLGDTCDVIESTTTIAVHRPISPYYLHEQTEYWSTSCGALKPTCIMYPKSAAEVSAIINVLKTTNETFAVKSGGHNPNNWFGSVDGGPLISVQDMNQVLLDANTGIANIGPGNRLDDVAAKLQGTGWTFVGGRIGNTGLGLLLGAGLSYMSAQRGWGASSIIAFEVVLADGSIVTASETQNADLWEALKGGGNNFGIVTSYIVQTYPQGDVWGGNLAFIRTPSTDEKLLQAVRDFTEYNKDDKAAIIVTAERAQVNLVDSWIIFLFYDGPEAPAGTFDNFTSIGPILNTARRRTYADLMKWSNWVVLPGVNVQIGTETIPAPSKEHAAEVLGSIHAHWRNQTDKVLLIPGIVASIAYQPFPRRICEAARQRSPDLLDCDVDADRMILEFNAMFLSPLDYAKMEGVMQAEYEGVRQRVLDFQAQGKLPDVHLPLIMNYGFYKQDYYGRLKPEKRALARSVAQRVDPNGLFKTRTGGWKP